MFIHWGVDAIPAGGYQGLRSDSEWIMSELRIPQEEYAAAFLPWFDPVKYDP
jgi:hypothetical protein